MAAELESRASELESGFWRVAREDPHRAELEEYTEEILQLVQRVWRAMSDELVNKDRVTIQKSGPVSDFWLNSAVNRYHG